jgi:hypothetical protein
MAFFDTVWYCNAGNQSTTGYYAVPLRPQNAAVVAGQLCRQFTAPAVGSERIFICNTAGTTANTTDATWSLGRGAVTTDGTAKWQEVTGQCALNGDATNTPTWAQYKAVTSTASAGQIIKRNNGVSFQLCTAASVSPMGGSEPAFSDTLGTTTTEASGTIVWMSLGPIGSWTGGQAPHARLASACAATWFVAGNTIYVGDNHAESQTTAITIVPALTQATMGRIICHNHSGSYPPTSSDLRTTATISTTGVVNLSFNPIGGTIYVYGLTFIAGVGQSGAASVILGPQNAFYYLDNCIFKLATTNATSGIVLFQAVPGGVIWNNCQVGFANAGQYILVGIANFTWVNTGQVLASGSTVPTNLFNQSATGYLSSVILEALDLSQVTSVFGMPNVSQGSWVVKDCKLNASATFATPLSTGQTVQYIRADSGATSYKSARYVYEGTETTETSITRVGGASDPTGQAQSRKIVTTANAQWLRPFKAEPYAIWNAVTGANVTVTVCGTVNAGALPNNDDIWLEVEYLGSSATPLGTIVTTTKSNVLAANAAVASDGSTWNMPAFTTWNPSDLLAMILSNNNLTATNTAAPSGVRAKEGFASGKYYWEVTVSTWAQSSTSVGFGLASAALSSGNLGFAFMSRLGTIIVNNVASGSTLGARTAGDTIGIALDVGNNLCWFRVAPSGNWNGSGTANPATGVGGVSISTITGTQFPAFWASNTGEVATANFGGSAFSGAVPSGFTSGWPSSWSPFKLAAVLSSPQPGLAGYIHARVRAAKPSTTFYIDPQVTLS